MPGKFSSGLSKHSIGAKMLFAAIILAIAARAFVFFMLPDAALTDSLYHLTIIKYILQNHALPMQGIEGAGITNLPVPLYHIISAMFFTLAPIGLNLATAKIMPALFSVLQLLLAFKLLKKLFPEQWYIGFAFVAMQPLLLIFGAVNYTETIASVFVLLCFWLYLRFAETGKNIFLFVMPFAIAGMALSKESATFISPAFFAMFLWELWKKRPKKIGMQWAAKPLYFAAATALLSGIWFILNNSAAANADRAAGEGLWWLFVAIKNFAEQQMLGIIVFYPLYFNAAFWFFLAQGFSSAPFGISPEIAFVAFSLITFPLFCFILYGLAKGIAAKEKPSVLLLFCFLLALALIAVRGERQIDSRMLVPIMPLFGIAACNGFKALRSIAWRRLFTALLVLAALYSAGLSGIYAVHFYEDNASHMPLYEFIKDLPAGSVIALHPNKARQIEFISEKESVSFAYFKGLEPEKLKQALEEKGVTHIAATCYKNPWDMDALAQLEEQGFISRVFEDNCSILFKVNW